MDTRVKYSDLRNDLLNLYCSTQSPSLEKVFIRFAQGYTRNLSSWLRKNKSLSDDINNPLVYDALLMMDDITKLFNRQPTMAEIIKVVTPRSKYLKALPMVISFQGLLNSEVRDILSPYQYIINTIAAQMSTPEGDGALDVGSTLNDLIFLQNSFMQDKIEAPSVDKDKVLRTQSLPKQRQQIFVYLLKRFSGELASASDMAGFTELASKFREGVLAIPPPVGVGEYINLDPITDAQMGESNKMAEYVFKYPGAEHSNYLHDLVEIQLMQQAGAITPEDAYKFKETYEKQRNVLNYIDEDRPQYSSEQPGIDTAGKITGNARLNPDFIYMLAMFFFFMQRKLKIPPSGLMI